MKQIHAHPVLSQQTPRATPEPLREPAAPSDPANEVLILSPPELIRAARTGLDFSEASAELSRAPNRAVEEVTAIVVNFKTDRLLVRCLNSFRSHYPGVKVVLVDNGSGDSSTETVRQAGRLETVTAVLNDRNAGHGPAMDQAIRLAETPYVFTMDTDCETLKGGFLEEMLRLFGEDASLYALGWLRYVDWLTGVPAPVSEGFMPYVHPSAAMYDREKYLKLYPFVHEGAPATRNMREALEAGYGLKSFPIHEYVMHLTAGTRRMWDGRWNPGQGEPPSPWRENAKYPI